MIYNNKGRTEIVDAFVAGEGAGEGAERERERVRGTISIKSDTECIDKDPNSGNILGNNFKLHVCHGKVERPESPRCPCPSAKL